METIHWNVLPPDPLGARRLAASSGVDPTIGQMLLNRGIAQAAQAVRFFSPRLEALEDPLAIPGMAQAIARLRRAIADKDTILIFGDSDTDGITASAILYELLTSLGGTVQVRLANRIQDGYGFSRLFIKELARSGIDLLMLVDCGTNQAEEIEELASQGIETIVVDHHVPAKHPAQPVALVNPHLGSRAGRGLCSAGLALKFVQAMWPGDLSRLEPYLDLAAIGTLADYAPLMDDNRIIVTVGLAHVGQTRRCGLAKLCEAVKLHTPSPEQILQRVVPCLNAAGRLGEAKPVWELLVESSATAAARLVKWVGEAHATTKALHQRIQVEAREHVNRIHFRDQLVMVVGGRGWHPGLMGPLAAQLSERYGRPAIALALNDRMGVGSGRSSSMFNLLEALRACEGTLVRYGGHAQACGLTISENQLELFRDQINHHARASWDARRMGRTLTIDLEVPLDRLTPRVSESVDAFRPFGQGNPRPLLLIRRVELELETSEGGWLTDGTVRRKIKGRFAGLRAGERYDVVVTPNLARGAPSIGLTDMRLSERRATAQPARVDAAAGA